MTDDREESAVFPATGMPGRDWWSVMWPDPGAVLRQLGIGAGMTVVDLCCGDGYFTAPLAEITGGAVYAVDIDAAMLEAAKDEVAALGAEVRGWILGDARQLAELVPEKADTVLIANTFHGVPDKEGLAKSVAKTLKAGGRFCVVNWHQRPREETIILGSPRGPATDMRMTPEELFTLIEPAGFRLDRVAELPPFHYGAIFRLS